MKTKHLLQCYRGLWLFLCFFLSLQSVVNPLQCSQFNACCVDDLILVVPEDKQPQAVISPIVKKSTDITVTIKNQVDVPMLTIIGDNLVLKDSIDYESPGKKVLDVKFLCSSTNSPEESLDFYFQITNVNDNPPKFPNTVMDVEIGELFPIGPWITVSANDADGDPIAYSLNPKSSGADYFILKNVNNAEISLNKALDYEEVKNLQLILQAEDQGNPPLKETATVTINIRVLDIDNKPPSFQPCKFPSKNICVNAVYSGDVTIKKPETGPLTLTPGPLYALDGDKVLNEPIVYEIIDGDQNNHFKIDATSGNITLVNVIDTLDPVVLTVMASQQNDKYKYTTTTVTIKVLEVNHNKPTFATQPYTGIVMLNSEVDSIVVEKGTKPLIVQAEDADFPAFFNPSITYEIKPSDKFKITRDGFIFTKVVLSNPGELIKLKIIALDETSKETAECDLEVQVSNADGSYPTVDPSLVYGVKDMVALGVPLAILLLIALIVIAILLRKISKGKMEWKRIRKLSVAKRNAFGGSSNSTKPNGLQFVNEGYLEDDKPSGLEKGILKSSWTPTTNEASITALAAALEPKLEASVPTKASEKSKPQNNNSEDNEGDGDKEVKSILTKERKSDEGYKAVWFREDIDPEAKEERVIETGDDDDAEEMEEDKPGRNRGVSFAPEDDNDEQSYQL
uniref:Cadherin domain-containing protein n=1 Tax=Callorhinchus milii TaxID=7868 RepID=A0A4W3K5U0_CALMI|eukprot:gi/632981373/ref/XP_007907555.1/ PREDICTED: cadherin-related family member 5 isoform X7 [Callorhinchus milii]